MPKKQDSKSIAAALIEPYEKASPFLGLWPRLVTTIALIESMYFSTMNEDLGHVATTAPQVGLSLSGIGAIATSYYLIDLYKKPNPTEHEKISRKILAVDLASQVTTSSAFLLSFIPETAPLLNSTNTLTGAGVSVLSNIFIVGAFLNIGLSLTRAFTAQKELTRLREERDITLNSWPGYSGINDLSEQEKMIFFNAILTDKKLNIADITQYNKNPHNKEFEASALDFKNYIMINPEKRALLYEHYSKINDQRFARNGAIQTALFAIILTTITLVMIAFPPSLVIVATFALAAVITKLGWDMWRSYKNNEAKTALENEMKPNKETTTSAYIDHTEKFKAVLREMKQTTAFNPSTEDTKLINKVELGVESFSYSRRI